MSPKFYTTDGREVQFVAATFPGDEEFFIAGAKRVSAKNDDDIDCERLIAGLHSGRFWGFRIVVAGEVVGGAVTDIIKTLGNKEQLYVWLIWGGRIKEWLAPGLQAAKQMANDLGIDGARFSSCRWGWIKLLPKGRLSWILEL